MTLVQLDAALNDGVPVMPEPFPERVRDLILRQADVEVLARLSLSISRLHFFV